MMSYPASQGGGGTNSPYYQSDGERGRGLDQALQLLVERDQRRELKEEQRSAYLSALLRLLSEAERTDLVGPDDVQVIEEEQDEEEDQGPAQVFQGHALPDYEETPEAMIMGRPPGAWWGLLDPQVVQSLLDRMEPQLAHSLLERARLGRLQQMGRVSSGLNQEALRRLVVQILSNIGPNNTPVMSPGRRMRRDLSVTAAQPDRSIHRRVRRSLDDIARPLPSNNPPLLRVKRLEDEEDEEKLPHSVTGLQRMKRIDTMATTSMEKLNIGNHWRKRRALNYDHHILIDQILDYMRE
ncbi:proprotein convertase subtilisin/kexin type 1 inhibitor, like isoform X2 [Betta splendens]|nr:proprotein convertase subtilisin/kexin type 1 inhibitor, like isoform X2 [Betta splendens]